VSASELFLDYWNNWLTVDRFASHYGMTREQALRVIAEGKESLEPRAAQVDLELPAPPHGFASCDERDEHRRKQDERFLALCQETEVTT